MATHTEGQVSKDTCRAQCELMYKKYSDQTRRGGFVSEAIPHVGRLQIRGGLAGVVFNSGLREETRGQTAKGFTDTLFATNNNLMNNKLFQPDPAKTQAKKPPLPHDIKNVVGKLDLDNFQTQNKLQNVRETLSGHRAAR